MAVTIVCDRCGRNSEQIHSLSKFIEIRGMKYSSIDETSDDCILAKDLCSQCLEDFINFIKEGPKNIMEDDLK